MTTRTMTTRSSARSPWMKRRSRSARGGATSASAVAAAAPPPWALIARPPSVRRCARTRRRDRGHDLLLARLVRAEVSRLAPEPQHEDAVGHLEHVGQVVADHDHRVPLLL